MLVVKISKTFFFLPKDRDGHGWFASLRRSNWGRCGRVVQWWVSGR